MNNRIKQFGCLLAVSMLVGGCAATKQAEPAAQPAPAKQAAEAPAAPKAAAQPAAPKAAPKPAPKAAAVEPEQVKPEALKPSLDAPMPAKPCNLYSVDISANRTEVGVGSSMTLYVQIKASDFPLKGNEAHGVKVTFSGLGFANEAPATECLRVHPNGSEIVYNLTAANAGTYNVVANVAFFPTRECEKSGVTKTSNPLSVTVK